MLYLSAFLMAFAAKTSHAASWNYEEPDKNTSHWKNLFAECDFHRQSPIDLPVPKISTCTKPLELEWTSQKTHYAIRNNGHSLQAIPFEISHAGGGDLSGLEVLHHRNDTTIRLKNSFFDTYESDVNREYCFDSLHFHWSTDSSLGSEHTINGESYPLEVHLVHYSCDYPVAGAALKDYATGAAALNHDDENVLAVIGIMFEIGEPNPILGKMLDDMIIEGIYEHHAGTDEYPHLLEFFYTEFDLKELLPESREMVAYLGSLTTPPCYETVRWHVMTQPMTVSENQMELFRTLLEGTDLNKTISPNYRPIMPRHGRKIYSCQEDVDADKLDSKLNPVKEVDGDKEDNLWNSMVNSKDSDQWKNIALAFIILFGVTSIICIVVLCYICKSFRTMRAAKQSYQQTEISHQNDDVRVANTAN